MGHRRVRRWDARHHDFLFSDVIWINEYGHIVKDDRERQRLSNEIDELMKELWEDYHDK